MSSEYLNNKSFERIIIQYQNAQRKKKKFEILSKEIEWQKENSKVVKNPLNICKNKVEETNKEYNEAQSILAQAFYTLSNNIVRYAKFSHLDDDDAVQEGVLICFERSEKFDPKKGKAFNYMTTCILNHFRQLWRSAKNYNELKRRYSDIVKIKLGFEIVTKGKENNHHSNNVDEFYKKR
jgi:DNA-directed RNA polymerase specialized sigma subunit